MDFIKNNKITEELLNLFNSKTIIKLNKRLDENNYIQTIGDLRDWHFLRGFSIKWLELTTYYIHLLDKENFNEN